jgi:membrane protein
VRFVGRLQARNATHLAAALTYYSVLALFPALIVAVALLGLVGLSPPALDSLLADVARSGSAGTVDLVRRVMNSVLAARGHAALLSVGLVISLWSASSYVGAFVWAVEHAYGVRPSRPWWWRLLLQLGLAVVLLALLALAAAVVVVSGPAARWLGNLVGAGGAAVAAWSVLRWPLFALAAAGVFLLLYRFAPGRCRPVLRHLLPGAAVGVAVWLSISYLFGLYVAHFGSYNRTYGLLGGIVAFLVWLWLLNLSLLIGTEVNDGLEQRRQGAAIVAPGPEGRAGPLGRSESKGGTETEAT